MKKLTAIFLLVIFLFNLVGYRGWFYVAETQWETQLQNELDKEQYNEADLITIRAPLQLPYVTDTREFQRTDGEVIVDGKIYRYVKSKIENGEYVLLCLPDHNKQKLEKAKKDFFAESNLKCTTFSMVFNAANTINMPITSPRNNASTLNLSLPRTRDMNCVTTV